MPIYPVRCCSCSFRGDVVARVRDIDRLQCPECGGRAEQDYTQKRVHNTNTRFTLKRQRSWAEGFTRKSAKEAQRLFGEKGGQCIQDDGTVLFKDRKEQEMYATRKAELERKAAAKRRAKGLRV